MPVWCLSASFFVRNVVLDLTIFVLFVCRGFCGIIRIFVTLPCRRRRRCCRRRCRCCCYCCCCRCCFCCHCCCCRRRRRRLPPTWIVIIQIDSKACLCLPKRLSSMGRKLSTTILEKENVVGLARIFLPKIDESVQAPESLKIFSSFKPFAILPSVVQKLSYYYEA